MTKSSKRRSSLYVKEFTLGSLVHSVNLFSFNFITHGGLLLSFFLVLLYNSFYPVEAFILPYLLARYLGPLITTMNSNFSQNTVAFTAVLVSILMFLQDDSIPETQKKLLGIPFGSTRGRNTILILFLVILLLHARDCMAVDNQQLGNVFGGILIGGIIGYVGYSIGRIREEKSSAIWLLARFLLALIFLFLLLAYIWSLVQQQKIKS